MNTPPIRREAEILCPRCGYKPRAEDRWDCVPSCGTRWHTFWTGGVCPGCAYVWPVTQCPACGEVSPHRQWYRAPEEVPAREGEQEEKVTAGR